MGEDPSVACPILHVDMDAFYASVATRGRPDLIERPVVVGGGERGVVLAANYAARRYGIASAMPMTRARRLCPHLVVVAGDFTTFSSVSASVMEIMRGVTPQVEVVSLDEAFLDVSGSTRRLGTPRQIAEQIRSMVFDEQRITCSVGVSASASVAKVASRRAKPDGVVVVSPDRVTAFLHPLDVGALWGVGEKTRAMLHRLGLITVGDLAHTPLPVLRRALGTSLAGQLFDLAWGRDSRSVTPTTARERSIGADETFSRDIDDRAVILRELLRLSDRVARRMRLSGLAGRTITVKVRFADFTVLTRSRSLPEATDLAQEIYRTAASLYDALGFQRVRLRLIGVRVEGLRPRVTVHHQHVLGEREQGWVDAERAMDRAVSRFGSRAVQPATLLPTSRSSSPVHFPIRATG